MSAENSTHSPEQKQVLEDNARKFRVEAIDPKLLEASNATSFTLIVDWLEIGESSEKKIAYKKFDNGDTQILLISKTTKDGSRTSEKQRITKEQYNDLLSSSVGHLEKRRHEFEYTQNNIPFLVKYDEYVDGEFCMLEVDASNEAERMFFNPNDFPADLTEVTGDPRHSGSGILAVIQRLN